jgi:NOL1/NOP2/fmu family ribosome biogenesis protein
MDQQQTRGPKAPRTSVTLAWEDTLVAKLKEEAAKEGLTIGQFTNYRLAEQFRVSIIATGPVLRERVSKKLRRSINANS